MTPSRPGQIVSLAEIGSLVPEVTGASPARTTAVRMRLFMVSLLASADEGGARGNRNSPLTWESVSPEDSPTHRLGRSEAMFL